MSKLGKEGTYWELIKLLSLIGQNVTMLSPPLTKEKNVKIRGALTVRFEIRFLERECLPSL